MNIVITQEEFNSLYIIGPKLLFGSHLYGTNNEKSDEDYLCFIEELDEDVLVYYPVQHQFQYKEDGADYIITTYRQFIRNLVEGDSIINAEILMFHDYFKNGENKLELLRTFKICRAFLGFCKRDLKQYFKNKATYKVSHAARCLYIAKSLLVDERIPELDRVKEAMLNPSAYDIRTQKYAESYDAIAKVLQNELEALRLILSTELNRDEITLYPKMKSNNTLIQKFINGANTKEFKYA